MNHTETIVTAAAQQEIILHRLGIEKLTIHFKDGECEESDVDEFIGVQIVEACHALNLDPANVLNEFYALIQNIESVVKLIKHVDEQKSVHLN